MSQPFKNWNPVEGTNEEWWMHECKKDGTLLFWKKSWGGNPNLVHVHQSQEGAQRFFAIYKPVRELYKMYRDNPSEDTKKLLEAFHQKMNANFPTPTRTEEKARRQMKAFAEKEFEEFLADRLQKTRAEFIENFKKKADTEGKAGLKAWFLKGAENHDPEIEKMISEFCEEIKKVLLEQKAQTIEERTKQLLAKYSESVSES